MNNKLKPSHLGSIYLFINQQRTGYSMELKHRPKRRRYASRIILTDHLLSCYTALPNYQLKYEINNIMASLTVTSYDYYSVKNTI